MSTFFYITQSKFLFLFTIIQLISHNNEHSIAHECRNKKKTVKEKIDSTLNICYNVTILNICYLFIFLTYWNLLFPDGSFKNLAFGCSSEASIGTTSHDFPVSFETMQIVPSFFSKSKFDHTNDVNILQN
jgi:hypothetical protein